MIQFSYISQNKAAEGSPHPRTRQASVIHNVYGTAIFLYDCSAKAVAIAKHSDGVISRACFGDRTAPAKAWDLAVNVIPSIVIVEESRPVM